VLADDMVLVVPAAGEEFWAHPLPTWSAIRAGTVRWSCRINEGVPVRALTLLAQSESDGLEPLGSGAATIAISNAAAICFHYLDGGLETDRSRLLRKKIFENASALVKNLPVYVLRVSLAGKFWEKIEAIPDNERTGAGRLQSIARQALPG